MSTVDQQPVMKRCAACRKESPVSEMKTCMHNQMHRYVCDTKCMHDFYNPPQKQPAAVAVRDATGRTPQDYAIEHAEYLAVAAESVISDYRANSKARIDLEDADGEDAPDEEFEAVNSTENDLTEALINLHGMIYEFRKHRDRAAAPHPVSVEQKKVGEIVIFGTDLKDVSWSGGKMPAPGTKLYAAPPAAPDVAGLVEALENISGQHIHDDGSEWSVDVARKALAAHRAQQVARKQSPAFVVSLPVPVKPEEPDEGIDDSWMDAYNSAMRMRADCVAAIEQAGGQVAQGEQP